jgi:hypothetical protein
MLKVRFLRPVPLFVAILLIALVLSTPQPGRADVYLVDFPERRAEFLMLQRINALRYRSGLPLIGLDESLSEVCRRHALDMACRDYFDHFTPDGQSPDDRVGAAGLPYQVSENIGIIRTFGRTLPEVVGALMDGFLKSPNHRANILDPNVTHVGIGFYQDIEALNHRLEGETDPERLYRGFGTVLVVQNFCRRRVRLVEPSPFSGSARPGEFLSLRLDFTEEVAEAFLRIVPFDKPRETFEVPLSRVDEDFRARFAIEEEGRFQVAIYASSPLNDWFYREKGRFQLTVSGRKR